MSLKDRSAAAPAARAKAKPSLHARILSDMRDAILSGAWPPGHRIPYEHELTAEYGCSRMTVNKVMTQLVDEGLIERRRRAGSFVRLPRSQAAVLEIHDVRTEVEALGLDYRYALEDRTVRTATAADARVLGVEKRGRVVELRCRHFAASRVFCLERRLINLDEAPEALEESFAQEAPGPWLVRLVPWTAAEHRISAFAADEETAASGGVEAGAPCLAIERRTWRATRPVTFVRLVYPGPHELVARFSPRDDRSGQAGSG